MDQSKRRYRVDRGERTNEGARRAIFNWHIYDKKTGARLPEVYQSRDYARDRLRRLTLDHVA